MSADHAYLESDSMAPRKLTQRPLTIDLQLSLNQRFTERLDALEAEVKRLKSKVSAIEGRETI